MTTRYLMNPYTGSVDTEESWISDGNGIDELIQVRLADGSEVPEDFDPCDSADFDWVEVK